MTSLVILRKCRQAFTCGTLTATLYTAAGDRSHDPLYSDVPKPRRDRSERKPYPTPMKELVRRAKEEKEMRKVSPCRVLENPPDNGLLVAELVDVAKRVYRARQELLSGLGKLLKVFPIHRCRFCSEVHVGHVGHEIRDCLGLNSGFRSATHVWKKGGVRDVVFFPRCFHLYDRVGRPRVLHDERYSVPRIPAVLELCIQAGVDIEKFPSKRRTKPVYSIEGRIVDFEDVSDGMVKGSCSEDNDALVESDKSAGETIRNSNSKENQCTLDRNDGIIEGLGPKVAEIYEKTGNLKLEKNFCSVDSDEEKRNLKELSVETLESWFELVSGVKKIMEKYKVWACGYCPEVQVGPKGHKVRMCKATKHQMRDGMHAWQEATIDDIVGPNYVWHVRDPGGPALDNSLKRYYGKAPAIVELCVQAGAPVPDQYRSMMRLDVVPPERDEVDLVA